LLGLFLRINNLGKESLWYDEIYGISIADSEGIVTVVKEVIEHVPMHTYLYYVTMHFWIDLFGNSEFSVRFPSLIFGVLGIFMIYKVGKLLFDKETGILASLILAVSQYNIYYSQEARMYSLLAFLTLVSFYFFIKVLNDCNSWFFIGYLISSILLMYTHLYGSFVIIAQNFYVFTSLILFKGNLTISVKKWIFVQIILLLLFAPQLMIFMEIAQTNIKNEQFQHVRFIPNPNFKSVVETFENFSDHYYPLESYSGPHYLFIPFLLLIFFSIIPDKKSNRINSLSHWCRIYLLILWLLAPVMLPFIMSKILAPLYLTRYMGSAPLAMYLLVAKGIRDINHKNLKTIILIAIVGLSLYGVIDFQSGFHKPDFRKTAAELDSIAESGDLLYFNPAFSKMPFMNYLKRKDLFSGVDFEKHNRVWVIITHGGNIPSKIYKTHSLQLSKSYDLVKIYLFEKQSDVK